MATIKYIFADGHTEEVEVTEEFKREYEFLLVREQAPHWKEMKQKERAGLRCPSCANTVLHIHDYRMQKIKDLSFHGKPCYLILRKRRYV